MSNPLPPAVHGNSHEKLDLGHFQWRGVTMPQQITNQSSVVTNFLCSISIADPSGLNNAAVIAHYVDQTDKTIIQNRKLLPPQFVDLGETIIGGLPGFRR